MTLNELVMAHEAGNNDLVDVMGRLTPAQWRAVLQATAAQRCVVCGHFDGCQCDEETDEAKALVVERSHDAR